MFLQKDGCNGWATWSQETLAFVGASICSECLSHMRQFVVLGRTCTEQCGCHPLHVTWSSHMCFSKKKKIAELSNQESEVSSAIDIATNLEANPAGIGNDNESTIHQSDVSSAAYVISHWQHREDRSSSCNQTKASTYAENGNVDSSSTESTVKESHNSCASQHDRPVDLMEQSVSAHNIQNNPVESPYSLPTTQRKGAKVVNKSMTKAESASATQHQCMFTNAVF